MTRRSGLGRGLGALIPGADTEANPEVIDLRESALRSIPIDDLSVNRHQPRRDLDQADLQPLVDSIRELGVLQPLLVRELSAGRYELIAGERRWRSAREAGLSRVPVIVRPADDIDALQQALVENLHRKDLNPLDEAASYRQLIDDFGMTHIEVAKRMGKSRTAISNLLRLLQLPPKVQRFLAAGQLSEGHGRALLAIEGAEAQLRLAEKAVRDQLPVRAVEDAVRVEKAPAKLRPLTRNNRISPGTAPSAPKLEWSDRLSDCLATRVSVSTTGRRGRITIDFADLEDLERIGQVITTAQPSS